MKNQFIIFGLGTPGLFILRELSHITNDIHCIARKTDVGIYSKFGKKHIAENANEIDEILKKISNSKENINLIITSDFYLTILLEKLPYIFDKYNIIGPNEEIYKVFNDKILTNEILDKYKLSYPITFEFSKLDDIPQKYYPLILKHNITEIDPLKKERVINKTKIINSETELQDLHFKSKNNNKLILQKAHKKKEEVGYGGFYKNGKVIADIFVNQCRQHPIGVSSYVYEINKNEHYESFLNKFKKMLREINYTGFIEVDILLDTNNNYYVLDVNPRPWGFMSILKKKYSSIYKIFDNEFNYKLKKSKSKVEWVNIFRDTASILKNNPTILPFEYYNYFKKNVCFDILDFRDMKVLSGVFKKIHYKIKR